MRIFSINVESGEVRLAGDYQQRYPQCRVNDPDREARIKAMVKRMEAIRAVGVSNDSPSIFEASQ